jgi:hypothetical protein
MKQCIKPLDPKVVTIRINTNYKGNETGFPRKYHSDKSM